MKYGLFLIFRMVCVMRVLFKPYRVAILDDDIGIVEILRMSLESRFNKADLIFDCFVDFDQAVAHVSKEGAEIVISDIHLPGVSLLDLFKKLNISKRDRLMIAMSGDISEDTISGCYYYGARFYLKKPFKAEQIASYVANCVEQLDSWKEHFDSFLREELF